jgi:phosphate transporter
MGGIALGKGVISSGLLNIIDDIIRKAVTGYKLYQVVLILSPIVLVRVDPSRTPRQCASQLIN